MQVKTAEPERYRRCPQVGLVHTYKVHFTVSDYLFIPVGRQTQFCLVAQDSEVVHFSSYGVFHESFPIFNRLYIWPQRGAQIKVSGLDKKVIILFIRALKAKLKCHKTSVFVQMFTLAEKAVAFRESYVIHHHGSETVPRTIWDGGADSSIL